MKVHTVTDKAALTQFDPKAAYYFPPTSEALMRRAELTNRSRGWLTPGMIDHVMKAHVGIAGAGGMGGHIDDSLVRACIELLKVADSGFFDYSNIHRQYGASTDTVGSSKTFATIDALLKTVQSTGIIGYGMGINKESIRHFLEHLHLAIDSIEFHALGARCLLHATAQQMHVPVMNGNSVGFGTNVFVFQPGRLGLMDVLPFSVDYAYELEHKIADGTATKEEYDFVCRVIMAIFLPSLPNYGGDIHDTRKAFLDRLYGPERTVSIVTTNPKMAAGELADHILLFLIQELRTYSAVKRLPVFPEYYHYDAALRISETRVLDTEAIRHDLTIHLPTSAKSV